MSINPLSSTSSVNALELPTEDFESFKKQYDEFKSIWEDISKSDSYKINEPYITDIKNKLEELLKELDKVVEDGYNPDIVEEAMQALGALLKGSNIMMSLEVRLKCLETLIKALEDRKISEDDFNNILSKIDNPKSDYSEKDFYKDFHTSIINNASISESDKKNILAKINDSETEYSNEDFYKDFHTSIINNASISESDKENILAKINDSETEYSNEDFYKDYYAALIKENFKGTELTGKESLEDLKESYNTLTIETVNESLAGSGSHLNAAKGIGATTSASLALRVMQANHQFKGLELEISSDEKKEQEAQKNPMFRKLRDEGIWKENTIDRHQEMLEEECINELKKADRK